MLHVTKVSSNNTPVLQVVSLDQKPYEDHIIRFVDHLYILLIDLVTALKDSALQLPEPDISTM